MDSLHRDALHEIIFRLGRGMFPMGEHLTAGVDPFTVIRSTLPPVRRAKIARPFFNVLRKAFLDLRHLAGTSRFFADVVSALWRPVYRVLYDLRSRVDLLPRLSPPAPKAEWTPRHYEVAALMCAWPANARLDRVIRFERLTPSPTIPNQCDSRFESFDTPHPGDYDRGLQFDARYAIIQTELGWPALVSSLGGNWIADYSMVEKTTLVTEAAMNAALVEWERLEEIETALKAELAPPPKKRKRKEDEANDEALWVSKLARYT